MLIGWAKDNDRLVADGKESKTNLQLHPPRWEKATGNITTNLEGNLKLPLVYESQQMDLPGILVMKTTLFDESKISKGLSEVVART